jgi:hypothetical protein
MDGSTLQRQNLKAFAWARTQRYGDIVSEPCHTEGWSPAQMPDFVAGGLEPVEDGRGRYGWDWYKDGFATAPRRLVRLRDASVLRRSLNRDRWHIVLDDGICASDSYHDGAWLGPHIGETVRLGTESANLTANIMDDVPVTARVKKPAVLISHFWAENYAHTLLETASRFWAWEQCPDLADLPVVWELNRPWQKEVAEWLCPGKARPMPASHTQFDTLYVPSFYSQIGSSQASVRWLRKRFGAPEGPGKRRLYVTRADATERRVTNEDEILAMLRPMGFECVMLTGMSVAEQRDMFRDAEIVVMPHGAGCANMIFAGAGAKFIEFVPKSYQHHMFWHIAKWSDQWYGRIVCNDGENKDMHVDSTVLGCALEAADM